MEAPGGAGVTGRTRPWTGQPGRDGVGLGKEQTGVEVELGRGETGGEMGILE